MKKTLALLLAALMLLTLVPAMAEDVPTVTILWTGDNQWVDGCLVEKEIEKLEAKLTELDELAAANGSDYQKLMEIEGEKESINLQLEEQFEKWEELSSLL